MLYMVECGFSDPAREADWNAFYSGPKLESVLSAPGFLRSQRFRDVDGTPAPYIAVHHVAASSVLESNGYRSVGGGSFLEWQSFITNWRRTLFDGLDFLPAVGAGQRLLLVDAPPSVTKVAGATIHWLRSAGLGNLVPSRGIAIIAANTAEAARAAMGHSARICEPITQQLRPKAEA